MTDTPKSASPTSGASGVVPTAAEALGRLDMPLLDAMTTQRALRRVLPNPVDDAVVLKCIELALHAPTSANGQNWEFIVVKDPRVKEKLAKRYRQGWKVQYGAVIRRAVARDESMAKIARAVQWQVDHHRGPGSCGGLPATRRPRRAAAVRADVSCGRVGILGFDVPRCAEPVAGGTRHGARCVPDHLAAVECDFGAQNSQSAARGNSLLHRDTRLAARALRPDHR
jgi:hypothetical protein